MLECVCVRARTKNSLYRRDSSFLNISMVIIDMFYQSCDCAVQGKGGNTHAHTHTHTHTLRLFATQNILTEISFDCPLYYFFI